MTVEESQPLLKQLADHVTTGTEAMWSFGTIGAPSTMRRRITTMTSKE